VKKGIKEKERKNELGGEKKRREVSNGQGEMARGGERRGKGRDAPSRLSDHWP